MKNAGSNAWVLTGWQVNPDATGAGYVAPDPTHSAATTAHGKVGAGFGSSVDQPVRKRQRTAAVRRALRTVDLTLVGTILSRPDYGPALLAWT